MSPAEALPWISMLLSLGGALGVLFKAGRVSARLDHTAAALLELRGVLQDVPVMKTTLGSLQSDLAEQRRRTSRVEEEQRVIALTLERLDLRKQTRDNMPAVRPPRPSRPDLGGSE